MSGPRPSFGGGLAAASVAASVVVLTALAVAAGCGGPQIAEPGNLTDAADSSGVSTDGSAPRKPRQPKPGDAGLFGSTPVRAVMVVFTLPVGTLTAERDLRDELDEDAVGVRQRTLLRHNGLLMGLVDPERRAAVIEKLAKLAVEPPSRSVSQAGPRGRLSLGLVRHQRSRVTLFQYELDGSVSAHQYNFPVGGWEWESVLSPSEPEMIRLSGVPTIQHIRDGQYVGRPDRLRAPPDLSPTELLELLPTRRETAAKAAAAKAAARGDGDFGPYAAEELDRLRVSVRVPSGGALVLAPVGDAVGPSRANCAGRLLLTDGPRDVGVEYVVLMAWDLGEAARTALPALPTEPAKPTPEMPTPAMPTPAMPTPAMPTSSEKPKAEPEMAP